jgi:hypothetical protein
MAACWAGSNRGAKNSGEFRKESMRLHAIVASIKLYTVSGSTFSEKRSCINSVKAGNKVAASRLAPWYARLTEVIAIAIAGALPEVKANTAESRISLREI